MTSELRPAVEVWWKATDAWKEGLSPEDATQAAAAVIEADREAVRAPLLAEIERLRERLEIDPAHSMDGIYARDETIRGLDAELAKFKALAETLAGALRAYAEYCDICHGRGSIIEEDSATGADLWRDCPGCGRATEALRQYKEARDAS